MRHRRMVAPINANKHYVHVPNANIASGAIENIPIIDAVVAPAAAASINVEEGSVVKAVYIEMWIYGLGASGTDTQFFLAIEKIPANGPSMTVADSLNLGAYQNKKNILYTSQGVIGGIDTNSVAVIRNWFLIPRGKQRFGLGDRLDVNVAPLGAPMQRCGFSTYKEYR